MSNPTLIGSGISGANPASFSYTVSTAGNDLLIILGAYRGSTFSLSSITDSAGAVSTDSALAATLGAGFYFGVGIYRVKGASAGTHTITPTWSGNPSAWRIYLAECTPMAIDAGAPALVIANSASFASNSITPVTNGDLIFGIATVDASVTYSWSNGFTQNQANQTLAVATLTQATAASITAAGTISIALPNAATIIAYKTASTAPTVTSVNSGSSIPEGSTNVSTVGTGFASGMTATITQTGGVSVPQTLTYISATSGTFNLSMEPGTGDQLAFTDATYVTDLTVTTTGGTSAGYAVTLATPSSQIFETLASINPTSAYRITATPDLVIGDQLEASGNSAGTAASRQSAACVSGGSPTMWWSLCGLAVHW